MAHAQPTKHDPLIGAQACIVWHPVDRPPASALLRALRNKGMTLIDADNPHTAFASVRAAARVARRTILVLDTGETLSDTERVLSALERFAPGVICWAHTPGANPPLVPLVQTRTGIRPTPPRSAGRPSAPLRLVGRSATADSTAPGPEQQRSEPDPVKPSPAANPTQPLNARDVLDADELDALLAGEINPRQPRRGDSHKGKD